MYLPLSEKLTQLRRVCRAFPALQPACLRDDEVTAEQLQRAPLAVISSLLKEVRSVSCVRLSSLNSLLNSLLRLSLELRPPLSCLRQLLLHVDQRVVEALLTPLAACFPALRSLALSIDCSSSKPLRPAPALRGVDVQPLAALEQLRSLQWSGLRLSVAALLLISSLQHLEELDLGDCELQLQQHDDARLDSAALPASLRDRPLALPPSLCRLVCPSVCGKASSATGNSVLDQLLNTLRHADSGCREPQLTMLAYCGWPSADRLPALSSLPHLHRLSLHLPSADGKQADDLSDCSLLVGSHEQPRLPQLQHLSISWPVDCRAVVPFDVQSRVLRCYASQLQTLDLSLPAETSWAELLSSLLSCSALLCLSLRGDKSFAFAVEPSAGSGRQPGGSGQLLSRRLSRLHTLRLQKLPLSDTDVSVLCSALPMLEDCELSELPVAVTVVAAIGFHCSRLRRLRLASAERHFLSGQRTSSAASVSASLPAPPPSHRSAFPSLFELTVTGCDDSEAALGFLFDPFTIIWLCQLLDYAPALSFLRLDVELPLHQLRLLSRFPALQGLRWLADGAHMQARHPCLVSNTGGDPQHRWRRHWHQHPSSTGMDATRRAAVSAVSRAGAVCSQWQMRSEPQHLADFPFVFADEVDGRDGRQLFFDSLPQAPTRQLFASSEAPKREPPARAAPAAASGRRRAPEERPSSCCARLRCLLLCRLCCCF